VAGWSDTEFDAFVATRLPALISFGYGLTGDVGHSQDLVQSALMSVYLHSRRKMPDSPEAYIRRAVVNAYVSEKHKRRISEDLVEVVPDAISHPSESPSEQREGLTAMLAGLSPRQRAVMVLRYREDWSEAQIAEALGVSAGTVKKLASRGLAALREQLGGQNGSLGGQEVALS
jgi:RNA polymerase sigma-70 factor (sigma-E family)